MEMFRQIAPTGEVTRTKVALKEGEDLAAQLNEGESKGEAENLNTAGGDPISVQAVHEEMSKSTSGGCPFSGPKE
jgi:hypothetical protein